MLLLCLILSACTSSENVYEQIDKIFENDGINETYRKNTYSKYIDYYVPSDIHEFQSGFLSSAYDYNNSKLIMNINISGIVNQKYFSDNPFSTEGFFDENKLTYEKKGLYANSGGKLTEYIYQIFQYEDYYLTYFYSQDVILYGYCTKSDLAGMSSRILLMAKGANVKTDDILNNFTSRDVIDYEKKQVNLFETIMPVNGNINEFIIGGEDLDTD